MKTWKLISLFVFTIYILALNMPLNALAGGWAVITLDDLPEDPVAGQPLKIGFTVRQHGRTPMADLTPTISLENQAGGEEIVVTALPEGETGHYAAELVFPAEGAWEWSIQAFTIDQPMPQLTVSQAGQVSSVTQAGSSFRLPLILGAFSIICVGGALFMLARTRLRWALALLVAGLLVGGAGFAFAAGQPTGSSTAITAQTANEPGERLFMAKGCTTCHAHAQIKRAMDGAIYVDSGPDLSDFSADPEYLRRWLADPASIKPGTEMPNLNLDEAEIEALVVFLNSE